MDVAPACSHCNWISFRSTRSVERLETPTARPFVALTFDDGYADNLTNALPVMEKFAAPFTVYVTTGMITREIDAWWFGVAELVRTRDHIDLPEPRPI